MKRQHAPIRALFLVPKREGIAMTLQTTADLTKIGLIGTGLMGLPMAQRLHGLQPLMVYNRTPERLESLKQTGIEIAPTVPDLLQACAVVLLMLSNAQAIRELLLSEAARPHLANRVVIQMGTISPSESRSLQEEIAAAGGDYLEAPVLGSIPEAEAGKLMVMVGASPAQFQQWSGLLKSFGPAPILVGPVGTAAALKLALNQLISSLTTAFATSVGFVQRQGVDVEIFMNVLRQSALYAPTFDKKLQRMLDRDFTHPNFPTKHLLKDTNLFLKEAQDCGLQVDSLLGVRKILEKACDLGLAEEDYAALFAAVSPEEP
jgi:3-hydroxyisobutyrate dehydrogenase